MPIKFSSITLKRPTVNGFSYGIFCAAFKEVLPMFYHKFFDTLKPMSINHPTLYFVTPEGL